MEVSGTLDAGIIAHDERGTATACSSDYPESFSVGAHEAADGRIGTDVGHIDCAGEERFNGGWAGVEGLPIDLYARSHRFFKSPVGLTDHCLGVSDVGKRSHADGRLCPRRHRHQEEPDQGTCESLSHGSALTSAR